MTEPRAADHDDPSDEALARAYARTGDRAALERLIARRWPEAVRVARRVLGDPASAEDAAQEACVRLLSGLKGYDPARPFGPWFRCVLANTLKDALRSGKSRRAREEAVAARAPATAAPEGEGRLQAEELLAHVRRLPEDCRVAVVLHFYEGLGHEEVAAAIGCPPGTVSSRLRRGIERLRALMTPAAVAAALAFARAEDARAAETMSPQGDPPPAPARDPRLPADAPAAPELRRLEAIRVAQEAAVLASRAGILRALAAGLGLGTALVAGVLILRDPPEDRHGAGPALDGFVVDLAKEMLVPKDRETLERALGREPEASPQRDAPPPPPQPPSAPGRDDARAAGSRTASATATPTSAKAPEETDPLILRAEALRREGEALLSDLKAELALRQERNGARSWSMSGNPDLFRMLQLYEEECEVASLPVERWDEAPREGGRTPPPSHPSAHAGRLRSLEGAVVALTVDLRSATLERLSPEDRALAEAALTFSQHEASNSGDLRIPHPDAPRSDRGGSSEADVRVQAFAPALADYLLAKTDPERAARVIRDRVKGSNESAAIGALRTLTTAQALFREGDKDQDGILDYSPTLFDLGQCGLLDRLLTAGEKRGYFFHILPHASGGSEADFRFTWSAVANPQSPGVSGDRYFFVDESGVIRFSTTGEATDRSTAIGG